MGLVAGLAGLWARANADFAAHRLHLGVPARGSPPGLDGCLDSDAGSRLLPMGSWTYVSNLLGAQARSAQKPKGHRSVNSED